MAQNPYTLIIGDEENPLRSDLEQTLKRQNIAVLTSKSREEALKVLKEKRVNFIMVAPLAKRNETLEFLKELRQNTAVNHLPFIVLSSFYPSPIVSKMTARLRNARYLVWPLTQGQLMETVKELHTKKFNLSTLL